MDHVKFVGVREDAIHWGYWDQVIFIEEAAKRYPVQRLVLEVCDVRNVRDEIGYQIDVDRQAILDVPFVVVPKSRAA